MGGKEGKGDGKGGKDGKENKEGKESKEKDSKKAKENGKAKDNGGKGQKEEEHKTAKPDRRRRRDDEDEDDALDDLASDSDGSVVVRTQEDAFTGYDLAETVLKEKTRCTVDVGSWRCGDAGMATWVTWALEQN